MFTNVVFLTFFGWICAQDYYEERHKYQYRTQMEHLTEIPNRFEVKGNNAIAEFNKYLTSIQELAKRDNLTLIYKVKVEIVNARTKRPKKKVSKKTISKKYNIPLKKKNMKLSNFEIILRRRINDMGQEQQRAENDLPTTEKQRILLTTKQPSLGKYKPIISSVRTNYTKIVRPVRNKVITLTS